MSDALADLPRLLTAHLELTLFALLVGVCLSVPLGVLSARSQRLGPIVLGVAGVVQTVPSLALLALMVPLLAALGAPSIGYLPAFIALVLYSLLPVLRNTVTALSELDPALLEAARGVGMSRRESLLLVELPTALPTIIAGVRTATVWTVGAATLATPVGATSLGNYIFTGLQTRNVASVLVGCVSSAALALTLDGLTRALLLSVERRSRRLLALAAGAFVALYAYSAGALLIGTGRGARAAATIGAKTFTEQYILSDALARWLETRADLHAEVISSLGSSVLFDALRSGSVDVYVDYSGTIWANVMKRGDAPRSAPAMLGEMARELPRRFGVELVASLGFENTYALAMARTRAEALGVRSISDLARHSRELSIGGDYEFFGRPEWRALASRYGLAFREQRSMDSSLMYQAAASGSVDVISAFSTDGRIAAFDLLVIEDDLGVIPRYDAIVLANAGFARRAPRAVAALRALSGKLDAARMRELNRAVDRDGKPPRQVAERLVESWRQPAAAASGAR